MTTTIAIACHAGGVGKTTTTLHLARQIAAGCETIAIDNDPQHSLTRILGCENDGFWNTDLLYTEDVLANRCDINEAAINLEEDDEEFELVAATVRLQETAAWLQMQPVTHDHWIDAIDRHRWPGIYLIDCPPAADLLTINAICAADYVIVPVIPEPKGLDGLNRMRELVAWLNAKRVSRAQILGMVITQMDGRTKGHQQGVIDLQATGVPVLAEIPMAKGQDAATKLRHAYQPLVSAVRDRIEEDRHA